MEKLQMRKMAKGAEMAQIDKKNMNRYNVSFIYNLCDTGFC